MAIHLAGHRLKASWRSCQRWRVDCIGDLIAANDAQGRWPAPPHPSQTSHPCPRLHSALSFSQSPNPHRWPTVRSEGVTAEDMKNYIWLKPEIVAEIKFTEWTTGSVLRHPDFITLRDDKRPQEITRDS